MAILFHPASQNINPQIVVSSLVRMMIGKLNFGLDKPCTGPMEQVTAQAPLVTRFTSHSSPFHRLQSSQ